MFNNDLQKKDRQRINMKVSIEANGEEFWCNFSY